MACSLAALSLTPQSMPPSKRKRSRSSVEIFTLPAAAATTTIASTKRARTGIQEVITDSPPPDPDSGPRYSSLLPPITILPQLTTSTTPSSLSERLDGQDVAERDSEDFSTSSSESSEESDYDERVMAGLEDGYVSDCESGSTGTTSSSSSSSSSSDNGDSSEEEDEDDGGGVGIGTGYPAPPRSAAIGLTARKSSSSSSSPSSSSPRTFSSRSSLAARINSLLPRLAASNKELEEEREKGNLADRNMEDISDEAGDGGRYIEMNLGLGVLEERIEDVGDCSAEDGDEESDAATVGEDKIRIRRKMMVMKGDAMATLMGVREEKRPDIRVLG